MEFTYDLFKTEPNSIKRRFDTTNRLEEVVQFVTERVLSKQSWLVECTNNLTNKLTIFATEDDLQDHITMLERRVWRDKPDLEVAKAMKWDPFNEAESGILTKTKDLTATQPKPVAVSSDTKVDLAVKADHYNDYCDGLQWIDAVSRRPQFRDPNVFKGAVLLQIDKYLSRLGRKDNDLQELRKSLWYLTYLIEFIKNDNKPINVNNIAKFKEI